MEIPLIDFFLQLFHPHIQDVGKLGIKSHFLTALLPLKDNS